MSLHLTIISVLLKEAKLIHQANGQINPSEHDGFADFVIRSICNGVASQTASLLPLDIEIRVPLDSDGTFPESTPEEIQPFLSLAVKYEGEGLLIEDELSLVDLACVTYRTCGITTVQIISASGEHQIVWCPLNKTYSISAKSILEPSSERC